MGTQSLAAAESRRILWGKIRDNGVRSHRSRPLASALRSQRRLPPLPAATTGRRCARGLATLGARTGHYPHLEASVDFIYLPKRVACGWPNFIEKIKLQPVFNLVCLIVVGGQRLRPQIWGTSLPGVHIWDRIWLILFLVWVLRPQPYREFSSCGGLLVGGKWQLKVGLPGEVTTSSLPSLK